VKSILVSGCLGALIGLERQWDRQFHGAREDFPAGVRTFSLWAVLGTLCAYLSGHAGPAVFLIGFALIAGFMLVLVRLHFRGRTGSGLTTAASGVITYFVGALVFWDETRAAVVLTLSVLILLATKGKLHAWSKRMTEEDVRMALQFIAVSGVILPLVPDRAMGPFGSLNPHSIWLMVVFVSAVAFAGYVAVRQFGAGLGIALTGVVGGLASSTATTLAMSRQSLQRPEFSGEYATGINLACTVMLWRVALLVGVVAPDAFMILWPPLLLMSLPGTADGLIQMFSRSARAPVEGGAHYSNPLGLRVALQFAALYALVVLVIRGVDHFFGNSGVYVASLFSGLTDLDAITLSLSQTVNSGGLPAAVAAKGVVIAAIANTFVKAGMAASLGSGAMRKRVLLTLGATALLGVGALFLP